MLNRLLFCRRACFMTILQNTSSRYGSVAKGFHWLTALLILTLIPLGIIAEDMAHTLEHAKTAPDQGLIYRTTLFFSLHKTLGVTVFFVALLRIFWALTQEKPGLINGNHAAEAWAAETVHWLLYGSLVLVPLSGWVHHAATTGFAPIWWPFGQSLPFVPKDDHWAKLAGVMHYLLQWVLIAALVMHIAGAIKHHVIDKDATLRRMLPGAGGALPSRKQPGHILPFMSALAVWLVVVGGAASQGWFAYTVQNATVASASQQAEVGNWKVEQGTLAISVLQMGAEIVGNFNDWSAQIEFSETPDADGNHGEVSVEIRTASLSLGSVTSQAVGPGYLDAQAHPLAHFEAVILNQDGGFIAEGSLKIRDSSVPLTLPFTLQIDADTAQAQGKAEVDRRNFEIGKEVTDEASLGFGVEIRFDVTAKRAP